MRLYTIIKTICWRWCWARTRDVWARTYLGARFMENTINCIIKMLKSRPMRTMFCICRKICRAENLSITAEYCRKIIFPFFHCKTCFSTYLQCIKHNNYTIHLVFVGIGVFLFIVLEICFQCLFTNNIKLVCSNNCGRISGFYSVSPL